MKYFVSYSRNDSEFVKRLVHDLKKSDLNVWLDQMDIPVGAKWDSCIEQALQESMGVVLVLSQSSVKSENVMDEVNFAITKNKHIIPVVIDNCEVPFRLARIQQIAINGNYNTRLQDIVTTIRDHHNATPGGGTKVTGKGDIKFVKTDVAATSLDRIERAILAERESKSYPQYEETLYAKPDKAYVKPDKKTDVVPESAVTEPPKTAATHAATAKPKKSSPPAAQHGDDEKKGKLMYVLIAAVVVIFALWMFLTTSGKEFYSSLAESISDPDSLHELLRILFAGAVIGWVTGMIVDADRQSIWIDILLGITGGFISYKLVFRGVWQLTPKYALVNAAVTAGIGAVILTAAFNMVKNKMLYRE